MTSFVARDEAAVAALQSPASDDRSALPEIATVATARGDIYVASLTATEPERISIDLELATDAKGADLSVVWSTSEDSTERPLMLNRLLVPWAPLRKADEKPIDVASLPQLRGKLGAWPGTVFQRTGIVFQMPYAAWPGRKHRPQAGESATPRLRVRPPRHLSAERGD